MKQSSKTGERRAAAQMHALAAVRREIVVKDSFGARKYLREFSQAFRHCDHPLTPEELNQKVRNANILLVGDYHALAASQRFAGSLMEQIASQRPVVLCLEAVLSRDQAILDSWWRREIGAEELRRRLRFDGDWGYPWDPFYELLSTARDHAEAIYGLDCMPREDMRCICSRDRHAAAKISEARRQHPKATLVVLFGESHMAPEHLPRLLKELLPNDSLLTILQNIDSLYWEAVAQNATAVSAGPETVCVFNSSPLEKYESYRLCLERWNGDDQPDFAPAVYNVIFSLARTLGFRIDSPRNGTQPRYLADSLPEVVNVAEGGIELFQQFGGERRSGGAQFSGRREAIENDGCCYVPEDNKFFIREFNMPSVAAQAARFLRRACNGFSTSAQPNNVELETALAHFGARLLCPESAQRPAGGAKGEELYQSYIAGRTSRAAIRKIFLSR